jgi:hypothetical protein
VAGTPEPSNFIGSGCRFEVRDQLCGGLQVKRNQPVHKTGPAVSLHVGKLGQDARIKRRVASPNNYIFSRQGSYPPLRLTPEPRLLAE